MNRKATVEACGRQGIWAIGMTKYTESNRNTGNFQQFLCHAGDDTS